MTLQPSAKCTPVVNESKFRR